MSAQKRMMDTLYLAVEMCSKFDGTPEDPVGVGPRRGGQFKQYGRYCAEGLLDYVGDGPDVDGQCERESPVYLLTPKGARLVLEDAERRLAHHLKVEGHPCGWDDQVASCKRALAKAEARAAKADGKDGAR